ncbi:hypothetical protein [Pedobacter steynii]|uniref:Uncharacterized protein n=1 Tax=Pedobacter steynii TaxID=430522 RepID=A0A1D7QHU3_9SPHI|nr:hypothetical protein [Pedobacter steynii]AOM78238.1 hypothetical protein BFS30_14295 [Pedobacter steynii]
MEIAIKVLQTEISNRKVLIRRENLMFKDRKKASELLKEISKLKQALKIVKDHHQRKAAHDFE